MPSFHSAHPTPSTVLSTRLVALATIFLIALFSTISDNAKAGTITLDVIALEGGSTAEGTYDRFGFPSMISSELGVFPSFVDDPSVFDDRSTLKLFDRSRITTAIREPHPFGTELLYSVDFNGATPPSLNRQGDLLFNAEIGMNGGPTDDAVLLRRGDSGQIKTIVRDGDRAANGNGFLYIALNNRPSLNDKGEASFWSQVLGANGGLGDGSGIYRTSRGSLTRIARTGQIPPHGTSFFDDFSWPSLNNEGDVAFIGLSASGTEGVYRGNGRRLHEIARTGQTLSSGRVAHDFVPFYGVQVNDRRQVAFRVEVRVNGNCCADALYLGDEKGLRLLAYGNQSIRPGQARLPFRFGTNVALNERNQALFTAGGIGLVRADTTGLKVIVFAGDPVPGTVTGTFTAVSYDFALNDLGDVLFVARFNNGGTLENGLFYYSDRGGLVKVVEEGTPLAGNFIDDFDITGTSSSEFRTGYPSSLGNRGQFVFRFKLANRRTGIAVANICRSNTTNFDFSNTLVLEPKTREACTKITSNNTTVASSGDLTLRAGKTVVLGDGFSVEAGGSLEIAIEVP